jgi:hypothetical protein
MENARRRCCDSYAVEIEDLVKKFGTFVAVDASNSV